MEYEYGLMTKADKYLVESIYNILQNGIKDENPRPKYEDGTPAHTYFVTHQMRQYDLSKGEFPICMEKCNQRDVLDLPKRVK